MTDITTRTDRVMQAMETVYDCQTSNFDDWDDIMPNTGLYTRWLHIPAGGMIVGKKHSEWTVNILSSGTIIIMDDILGEQVKMTAPQVFESAPGTQKIGKALTDVVFMNIMRSKDGETKEESLNRLTGKVV